MNITELIKEEVIKINNNFKNNGGPDYYNSHIKYVVKNAKDLAIKYGADLEIVELGALLHDIAILFNQGKNHHIHGVKIAEELLIKYDYSQDKIEKVKKCILNHRGLENFLPTTIEEEIIADADVISHFDSIPDLFYIAFCRHKLDKIEGIEYVKKKLERDYNKLSDRSRAELKERYNNIMKVLFVEHE